MDQAPEARIIIPDITPDAGHNSNTFAQDVLQGLTSNPKYLSSRYMYDDEGSRLFQQIMQLDEYYVSNCEEEIFYHHKGDIFNTFGTEPFSIIDLGAGDGQKTQTLIEHAYDAGKNFTYVPIDISRYAVEVLLKQVEQRFPGIQTFGLVADYFASLEWLQQNIEGPKLLLFMGGNIGNFPRQEAVTFMKRFHNLLNHRDRMLLGIDLKKDPSVIHKAYNDAEGVTAAFNLNLLQRINREMNADFDLQQFKHFSDYNPHSGYVNSYLVSLKAQTVTVDQQRISFLPWECIHTEYSIKYDWPEIEDLAGQSGFTIESRFTDQRAYFSNSLWKLQE